MVFALFTRFVACLDGRFRFEPLAHRTLADMFLLSMPENPAFSAQLQSVIEVDQKESCGVAIKINSKTNRAREVR